MRQLKNLDRFPIHLKRKGLDWIEPILTIRPFTRAFPGVGLAYTLSDARSSAGNCCDVPAEKACHNFLPSEALDGSSVLIRYRSIEPPAAY
jgi:hypothetical protein